MDTKTPSPTTTQVSQPPPPWRPGLRNTPWLTIGAILLAIACVIASASIIVASNNQPVSSWSAQPAVLLAIITSISHFALAFTLSTAKTITWWRNALHGTSISQLYYIWDPIKHWRSLKSAISSGVDYRKILYATVIVSIANLATAPLFQRASHTRNGFITKNISLDIAMVEQLPTAYIGLVDYGHAGNVDVAQAWNIVSQHWKANATILMPPDLKYYCNGRCEGNVGGAGLITNCSSITTTVDLSDPINNGTTVFAVNFTRGEDNDHIPTFTLLTTYSVAVDNNTCVATIVNDTCDVKVAQYMGI